MLKDSLESGKAFQTFLEFIRAQGASALEMGQNSIRSSWTFDEVDAKLKGIMINIYYHMKEACDQFDAKDNFVAGANIAGFMKVADAMMAQGIV